MRQLKNITLQRLLSWGPCEDYRDEAVLLKLTGGRKSLTPLQICDLDIPVVDKLWVLLRSQIIPGKELHLLACDFAEAVLHLFEGVCPADKRPRAAIEAKRRWIAGEITDSELAAAWAAAWAARDAAWAARDAAWAAARAAAAWAAARDAAWDAAWAAAWAAARDAAAWAAAWAAARDAQLEMVRKVLEDKCQK